MRRFCFRPATANLPRPKEAAAKSIALIAANQRQLSFKEGGCVSCHAQNLTGLAVAVARANGIKVDEAAAAEQLKAVKLQWVAFEQVLLQRMDPPGAVDTTMYSLLHLERGRRPAGPPIDALIHNMAGQQRKDGSWHLAGNARPPIEDGDFSRTALSIRAMSTFTALPAARRNSMSASGAPRPGSRRPARAQPKTGTCNCSAMKWGHLDRGSLEEPLKKLMALQRADGGWAQTPELASDAYATGTVLVHAA